MDICIYNSLSNGSFMIEENIYQNKSHGSYKSYLIGFIVSLFLTLIPYIVVVYGLTSVRNTYIILTCFALLQFIVQLVFFLHIGSEEGPRFNLLSLIFTLIITVILVGGSLWVMYNMNANMML